MKHREIQPKSDRPEFVVFTDAKTKEGIIAEVLLAQKTLRESETNATVWENNNRAPLEIPILARPH